MSLSFNALNRLVERKMAEDAEYARRFRRHGRAPLSEVRAMSEEELVGMLREFGLSWDRSDFRRQAERYFSAQSMSGSLAAAGFKLPPDQSEDWQWMTIACLWERWLPDRPSFEMIDDLMQQGYAERDKKDGHVAACQLWWQVWDGMRRVFQESRIDSLRELDEAFGGTQSAFNWIQDFESELFNAGRRDPEFFRTRIALIEKVLEMFPGEDELLIENFRRGLAESHAFLGDLARAESLFAGWLEADPQWGWGWIGWSDLFNPFCPAELNAEKAEQILKRGLQVPDLRNRLEVLDRLRSLYRDTGRQSDADTVKHVMDDATTQSAVSARVSFNQTGNAAQVKVRYDFGPEGLVSAIGTRPRSASRLPSTDVGAAKPRHKVGRNDPCPCGSGKKFKKCCQRNEE